jgi:hypothetical protein
MAVKSNSLSVKGDYSMSERRRIETMRHQLLTTMAVLCGLLVATQLSTAQELTADQKARWKTISEGNRTVTQDT